MGMARNIAAALMLALAALPARASDGQTEAPQPGLIVVYGPLAPSREGDPDWREQVFFSVPADLRDRLFVRIYDPETSGGDDFVSGSTGNARTVYRLFGGAGAFTAAERPQPVVDGARPPRHPTDTAPVTGPGELLNETEWGNDRATDGRWVNLAALRARQGEVIDGRAYFRVDVQGAGGDDGNGFSLAVSLARDRNRAPAGLEMFAYRPTVRWSRGQPATQIWFARETDGPFAVQSFDAANGRIALVTDYADLDLRVSGQGVWSSDAVDTDETNLAISLIGGFEAPNDVTIAVFDAAGDPVPLKMPPRRAPVPARPRAAGIARPLADCRSVAFDASGSAGLTPLSYFWDFGDGRSAAEPVIAYRYAGPGRYTARLRVLEDGVRPGRGAEISVPVEVRDAPVAVAGGDVVVAPGQIVAFDGTGSVASDSPIAFYRWSFGDGSVAPGALAQKSYALPGQYRAVLRVEDDSDHPCNFGVQTRLVTVNFPPVAEAGADRSAVVGLPVAFSAAASYDIDGRIAAYRWDMGDGTVLEGETVTHTYRESGRYQVALRVTDDSGVENDTAADRLMVGVNAPPEPRFTIPPRPVSVSEAATLDASGSTDADGEILSYMWDFGDGSTGEGPVARYAWTRPGVFTVTLTVSDDSGTGSALQSVAMPIVIDAAPVADAGPDQFVTASEVVFDGGGSTDSDGTVAAWEWDFGDGTTGSGRQVRHAYERPGTYEVALVVRDDSGAPLNTDRDTMRVTINAPPIADAGPPQTVAPGQAFVLNGGASVDPDGGIAEYLWTFPDGSSARGARVSHIFAQPGLQRVLLTVSDDFTGGAARDEAEVLITVNAPPVAVAGADLMIAPGDTVVFDAGQSFDPDGALVGYRWTFDDLGAPLDVARLERAYLTPGIWSAQLVVTDDSGVLNATASDDRIIRVNAAPVAEAGPPVETDRLYVELSAAGSGDADGDALIYRWDFGDGTPPVFGERVTHVYPRSGIYPVTLRVDDGTGLSNARAVDATTVSVNARPIADAGGNRDVCSGEPILFDASDSLDPDGGLLAYAWDFGDGSVSDLVNPTKIYERPGTYPVTLRVRNETGTDRGTDLDRIAVLVREGPIADAGADLTVFTSRQVRFDGSGSTDADGAVNAFSWTFGDGGTGSGEQPVYVFERPGTYTVTLTITGEARGDCSPLDTDTAIVEVLAAPELAITGPERAGAGLPVSYSAALDKLGDAELVGHSWDFGDGTIAEGADVAHVFAEPGVYFVTLTTRLSGCAAGCGTIETRRKVVVNAAPEPVIEGPVSVAVGQAVTYDGGMSADSDGAITEFAWDFGDGTRAEGVLAEHRFAEPGVYTVALSVTDDAGAGNSRVVVTREVTVRPAPSAGLRAPAAICPATPVPWSVTAPDGTSVEWLFGDGRRASGPSVSHVFARPGLYPVTVSLDDGAGLLSSRRSEEVYARVNAAPTAQAGPDRVICPGDSVTFDAAGSGDPDGEITQWQWDFSDGVTLNGPVVERVFERAADLRVRLSVRDNSGALQCNVGTDTARILVNAAPQVDAGADITVPVGGALDIARFDASDARDPDGQGLRLSWNFGDGTEASGAVVRHRFTAPGSYTVTVRAQDATGLACGAATDTATVTAVPRE